MAIDGINNIDDIEKINRNWRSAALREVMENMEVVEEADSPVAEWAKSAMAMANMPDTVTYEMTGGNAAEFTEELNEITTNGLSLSELPESGEAVTAQAIQDTDNVQEEPELPEAGDEDNVNEPEQNNLSELPEEENPEEQEFTPEEEEEMRREVAELNPDLDVNSLSLDEILKRLGRYGMQTEQA